MVRIYFHVNAPPMSDAEIHQKAWGVKDEDIVETSNALTVLAFRAFCKQKGLPLTVFHGEKEFVLDKDMRFTDWPTFDENYDKYLSMVLE